MTKAKPKYLVPSEDEIRAAVDAELAEVHYSLIGRFWSVGEGSSVEDFKRWMSDWLPRVLERANVPLG